jgi:hypothetical protein
MSDPDLEIEDFTGVRLREMKWEIRGRLGSRRGREGESAGRMEQGGRLASVCELEISSRTMLGPPPR